MGDQSSKRIKMYWHRLYGEPIAADFLHQWPKDQMPHIHYVGEFTEDEWKEFVSTAHRDESGALVVPFQSQSSQSQSIEEV